MSVRSNLRKLERLSKFVQNVNTEAFKVGGVTYSLNERLGLPNMTHGKGNMYSWIRQEEGKKEGEKKEKRKLGHIVRQNKIKKRSKNITTRK